jgi:hypothetical protein
MAYDIDRGRVPVGRWVVVGLVGGIIAGLVFAMFEMITAAIMGPSFWAPLRMIGAIGLGQGALEPSTSLAVAAPAGLVIHMILSAIYGAAFGLLAALVGPIRSSRFVLAIAGTAFGLALWVFNFYVVAPIAFPWFGMANPVVQFVAHAFFFGTVLGAILGSQVETESHRGHVHSAS